MKNSKLTEFINDDGSVNVYLFAESVNPEELSIIRELVTGRKVDTTMTKEEKQLVECATRGRRESLKSKSHTQGWSHPYTKCYRYDAAPTDDPVVVEEYPKD